MRISMVPMQELATCGKGKGGARRVWTDSMHALMQLNSFLSNHPLTRDARLGAWLRVIRWQLRSLTNADVVIPWINDQRLVARRSMAGATGNIYAGLHEFIDMMLVLHFLRPGDLMLDIGANIGSYTVLASGVCRARTWAFEPDPQTAAALKRNIDVNALGELVTVHQYALGAARQDVAFTVGLDSMNKVADAGSDTTRIVRQERLDDLIGDAQPSMIKMDVEGYEEQVLRGSLDVLSRDSLKLVELETVSPAIERIMHDAGFTVGHYDPFSRRIETFPLGTASSNTIFVRDWPYVAERVASARKIAVLGQAI